MTRVETQLPWNKVLTSVIVSLPSDKRQEMQRKRKRKRDREESDFNLVTMLDIDESPIHFMSSDRSVFIVWRYQNNRWTNLFANSVFSNTLACKQEFMLELDAHCKESTYKRTIWPR
ncbi:hypothetical protein RHGRI_023725 [Rhododendron griersonianum]|uniref:Uncharacterized protein n=1 Tax=Rhododendron griersonianum TaxID=479676 RepID=A0AAV6JA09_9ERIC|nr:hypothetical protein RHGRI_023725 [Rhododendron griersonianum]